jgi:hypothetical protein
VPTDRKALRELLDLRVRRVYKAFKVCPALRVQAVRWVLPDRWVLRELWVRLGPQVLKAHKARKGPPGHKGCKEPTE